MITSLSFGQTEFSIWINSDVDVKDVSVSSFNLSKKFSSEFDNGMAIVKIPVDYSDQYSIHIKDARIDGWFNAGKIEVFLDFENDSLSISKTKKTPVYESQQKYFNQYNDFLKDKSVSTDFIRNAIIENE